MIGRALDRLIDNCIIGVGDFANKFFETYWPMTVSEHAKIAAADALAEREAEVEVGEPKCLCDTGYTCSCHVEDKYGDVFLCSCGHEGQFHGATWFTSPCEVSGCDCVDGDWMRHVKRPFADTDDFAEPVGEYPDLPKRPAGGALHTPATSRATNCPFCGK